VKRRLKIVVPVLVLALAGAAYKVVLAPGGTKDTDRKIEGAIVPLSRELVVNLAGGHYGKLSVALILRGSPPSDAEGHPVLEQEAAARAVITDELTGLDPSQLIQRPRREALRRRLLAALRHATDEPITGVLLTDVAVQ
jgi:flagellar basal body-associated protein FliL